MSLQDAVAQYLEAGGKVVTVPGFAAIKPMPQRGAAKWHTKKRAKAAQGGGPRADWYTTIDLACELEYAWKLTIFGYEMCSGKLVYRNAVNSGHVFNKRITIRACLRILGCYLCCG